MGMTSKQAADYLGVSRQRVTFLVRQEKIKGKMHGRDWDIDPGSVEAYKRAPKDKGGKPTKRGEN